MPRPSLYCGVLQAMCSLFEGGAFPAEGKRCAEPVIALRVAVGTGMEGALSAISLHTPPFPLPIAFAAASTADIQSFPYRVIPHANALIAASPFRIGSAAVSIAASTPHPPIPLRVFASCSRVVGLGVDPSQGKYTGDCYVIAM